jgi:formate dehydrogenase subunit gamma
LSVSRLHVTAVRRKLNAAAATGATTRAVLPHLQGIATSATIAPTDMTTHGAASAASPRDETAATLTTVESNAVTAALRAHEGVAGALLPVLHAIQDRIGYVPPAAVPSIAVALDLSHAEIHGVLTFYHHFRTAPCGQHLVRLCCAEACQAAGARTLALHAQRVLAVTMPGTSADGRFTLEPVYCLGNCACGPSLSFDDALQAFVTPDRFDELIGGRKP